MKRILLTIAFGLSAPFIPAQTASARSPTIQFSPGYEMRLAEQRAKLQREQAEREQAQRLKAAPPAKQPNKR